MPGPHRESTFSYCSAYSAGFCLASIRDSSIAMSLRLFSNRTAVSSLFLVFSSCMLLEWTVCYLLYYFEILKGSSRLYSSVQVLPFNLFLIPPQQSTVASSPNSGSTRQSTGPDLPCSILESGFSQPWEHLQVL